MRGVTAHTLRKRKTYAQFQLTRLMRGVTFWENLDIPNVSFQLTRLMRGVTTFICFQVSTRAISTHTPHARRDSITFYRLSSSVYFNSHASCEA